MGLRPLRAFRRWREKSRMRYLAQEPEREETERILDRFDDEVVGSRSPSMSRLKRWCDEVDMMSDSDLCQLTPVRGRM